MFIKSHRVNMKKSVLILICLLCSISGFSQVVHGSTKARTDYIWEKATKTWGFLAKDKEESTFFEINEGFTIFKHIKGDGTTVYRILTQRLEDTDEVEQYIFSVVSDKGKKYYLILDIKYRNLRFITWDGQRLIRYDITNVW
jgi:hypothetical protein